MTMKIPQPIPYQGSKRNIAKYILSFFPQGIELLVEPFAGSAAISIAAAIKGKASKFYLNDSNTSLMNLWNEMINNPGQISDEYRKLWNAQLGKEKQFYNYIRDEFNKEQRPDYFLYLLARCIKASVRYNSKGEFNQSPDNRRKGRKPEIMKNDIFAVSKLFKGRVKITSSDYKEILASISSKDLVYMDPPYQGVCNGGDPRYYSKIDNDEFLEQLRNLVQKNISFILSYDGRTENKTYGKNIPENIGVYRVEVNAGVSSQSTLLGKNETTYESIYLSKPLIHRLGISTENIAERFKNKQTIQQSLAK
ncbi:MAG: Dam family site-specific DNA-(adenine-N6)-methyltransferase [Euryarchaeota archaeon]|nr:Dam family site-specific DNA-(adenine-N6)-methyltransferase [Euryarchaeota archaeon]